MLRVEAVVSTFARLTDWVGFRGIIFYQLDSLEQRVSRQPRTVSKALLLSQLSK